LAQTIVNVIEPDHGIVFDQETAVQYVQAYRERWDEEGKQFGNDEK
jgi:hypothetical protein